MAGSRYHPAAEQRELMAGFERPIEELLPISRLHGSLAGETDVTWTSLAELGLLGIGLAQDAGGIGLGATEEVLLSERLGRQLASASLFATLIAVHCEDKDLAAEVAAGQVRVAAGWRRRDTVRAIDHAGCKLALVLGEGGLVPLEAARSLDGYLWASEIGEAEASTLCSRLGVQAIWRGRLILAAALCGVAGKACETGVAYAGMREQFGRPIGAFQAVKHHCAAMALAARSALDLATFAAIAFDDGRADAEFQIEAALLLAIDAALRNARLNIQIHGGIGFSDEADPHLLVKRAHVLATFAGGAEAAAARLALLPGAMVA